MLLGQTGQHWPGIVTGFWHGITHFMGEQVTFPALHVQDWHGSSRGNHSAPVSYRIPLNMHPVKETQ